MFNKNYYYNFININLSLLFNNPKLYKVINIINKEAYQLLNKINRIDLFTNNKDINVVNQLYYQISLLTPKTTTIILLTLINYSYPILPTPLLSNTLIRILLVYIPVIKEGEILS